MWDEELKLAITRELAWYPSSTISYHEDPPASTRHENARTPPTYQPKFVSLFSALVNKIGSIKHYPQAIYQYTATRNVSSEAVHPPFS